MSVFIERAASWAEYIIQGTDMSYTSFVFVGCLAVFFVIYFLLRSQNLKRIWILLANLVFYVWAGDRGSLIIVCATALVVYLVSRRMETIYTGYEEETKDLATKDRMAVLPKYKNQTKWYLWLALALILAVWIFVKVVKFLDWETVGTFRNFSLFRSVIVPLGISYYSLSAIGYLLDVYWQKTKPEHNFLTLFTVMTYFPHIVEGPISKYQKIIAQMNDLPKFDYNRVCYGLQLMLWGYIKKMVIADRLAIYTGAVFGDPEAFAGMEVLIAVIFSVFQLYADFSGCMDIVHGISEVIGIDLAQNFRQPLFAKSAAEFWRRWHITLGAWMREYIYMPISTNPRFIQWVGGMKKSGRKQLSTFLKNLIPSLAVWILTGLWHGTGMDYIVWGLYWCALIVLSTVLKPYTDKINERLHIHTEGRLWHFWQELRTSIFFGISRMFTVVGGMSGCILLWQRLFRAARLWVLFDGSLYTHGLDQKDFYVAIIGITLILVVDVLHERGIKIRESIAKLPLPLRWIIYYGAIFAILIFGVYGSGYDAASFIYGNF